MVVHVHEVLFSASKNRSIRKKTVGEDEQTVLHLSSWRNFPPPEVTDAIWPQLNSQVLFLWPLWPPLWSITYDPHYPLDDLRQAQLWPHLRPGGHLEMLAVQMTPTGLDLAFDLLGLLVYILGNIVSKQSFTTRGSKYMSIVLYCCHCNLEDLCFYFSSCNVMCFVDLRDLSSEPRLFIEPCVSFTRYTL